MRITNLHGLPEAIYQASLKDTYSRGASRMSVTQLIGSPRINALREKHHDQITVDVSDRLWALLGTSMHHLLEKAAPENVTAEERLFAQVGGWVVSGGVDMQAGKIVDFKMCSVWSVRNDKPEWAAQLNCYAFLVRRNKGIEPSALQICAILRDWRRADAERDDSYPQQPIVMVDIPIWEAAACEAYVKSRVAAHQVAAAALTLDEELVLCTDEERWISDSTWAVYKPKGKRAYRVLDNAEEAQQISEEVGGSVTYRPGSPKRCIGNYCSVADWCSQFQGEQL